MKRILICIAVLLLAVQAQAQGKFITDYKGMVFGKDLSEFEHLKKEREMNPLTLYSRYGDEHAFQGVPIKDQLYGFYKNKFCVVMFTAQGPSSYNALKAYFDANYGPASQPKTNIKQFTYTAGEVSIQFGFDDTRKVVEVSYMYNPIMRQMTPAK